MAKIILTLDHVIVNELQLIKARTTIGRRSVSDIHIDHLAVSGEHAVILKIGDDFYIEDIASTNGTRVNGQLVKKQLLAHNDVISFGKYQLKFFNESALNNLGKIDAIATPKTEGKSISLPATEETLIEKPNIATIVAKTDTVAYIGDNTKLFTHSNPPLSIAKIKLLNGSNAGSELTINKALTTLGKVGTQVAVINRRMHGYFVTHNEGGLFPSVNGNSIGALSYQLNHQDIIELAGIKIEFTLSPSADVTT